MESHDNASDKASCIYCKESHAQSECPIYKKHLLSLRDRLNIIRHEDETNSECVRETLIKAEFWDEKEVALRILSGARNKTRNNIVDKIKEWFAGSKGAHD